jgi:hypothetical protein
VCVADVSFTRFTLAPDAPQASEYASASGAITDGTTGLAWALASGTSAWSGAGGACAALDASSVGGKSSGWRLPSLVELLSIVDYGASAAPYVSAPFTGVASAPYWTATPNAQIAGQAWSVDFGSGQSPLDSVTTAKNVMCVNSN